MRIMGVVLALAMPLGSVADTPFAGKWVAQPMKTVFSGLPLHLLIQGGSFTRSGCTPTVVVPADGTEHPVAADPLMDTLAVRLIDSNRIELAQKIRGGTVWKGVYTVDKDRLSMRLDFEDRRAALPVTGSLHYVREGDVLENAHVLSGVWRPDKLLELSASGSALSIRDTDNGVALSAADGRSFDIHFDRQEYPLNGYLEGATVQVGRRTPNTLQVNRRQNGVLVAMTLGVVDPDGQTMTWGDMDWQCQMKTSLIMSKQATP